MARLLTEQWFDNNGKPLSKGKLNFYNTGSSTPADTYSDAAEQSANTNPVILDASGRPGDIWFSGQRRLVVTDANDVQIEEIDPIDGGAASSGSGAGSFPGGATEGDLTKWDNTNQQWVTVKPAWRKYRYWRMVNMKGFGRSSIPANKNIALTEIELVEMQGETDAAVQTNATLTTNTETFRLSWLNDGSTSHGADEAYEATLTQIEAAGAYYQWDFGDTPRAIVALRQWPIDYSSGSDDDEGWITQFEMQGSDDGITWDRTFYVDHQYSGGELPDPTLDQWSDYYWLETTPRYQEWEYVEEEQSSNFTAEVGKYYQVDSTSGSVSTITLPASPVHGNKVGIKLFSFDDTDITIAGNGNNIDGNANFTLDTKRGWSNVIPYIELTFLDESTTPTSYWAVTALAPPDPATEVGGGLTHVFPEQTANFNAVKGNYYYVDLNAAGGNITATLPASPSQGDRIGIMVSTPSGTRRVEVARNGNNIQGGTLDLDIVSDTDPLSVELVYANATRGWVVVRDGSTYTIAV